MKKMIKLALGAAVSCLSLTVAQAQPKAGDWEFTLGGGGQTFDSEFDDGAAAVAADVGYYINDSFEIGLRQNVGYSSGDNGDWTARTMVAADWNFQLGKFVPFIGATTGLLYGERPDTWALGPEAGVKFYVHQQTFIFARADYLWTFNDADDVEDQYDDGTFSLTVGVGFNW